MAVDNVTFLILWFLVMFITLSSGIIVIMYRVGCFKCENSIGIVEMQDAISNLTRRRKVQQDPEAQRGEVQLEEVEIAKDTNKLAEEIRPISISKTKGIQRQQTERSNGSGRGNTPNKVCTVCGDPITPDDDERGESSHPSCRDMDASFF